MGFLHNLKVRLSPQRMTDPDFGQLTFIRIDKRPERSYWEGEWTFPATHTTVDITLPGGETGPNPEARQFYLTLPSRFDNVLKACRPRLEQVFRDWRNQQLPQDIFTLVKLTGFGVENPQEQPIQWDVGFETTDDDWLGITIPFVGDTAMEPVVDT
jgi:hypothetical protein